jgi:hypothetical protein
MHRQRLLYRLLLGQVQLVRLCLLLERLSRKSYCGLGRSRVPTRTVKILGVRW